MISDSSMNASLPFPPTIQSAASRIRSGRERAFTLVEIVVVLAIIMIFVAVGIPLLSDPSNRARQSARDLVRSQFQRARAHAIATGTTTSLMIPDYFSTSGGGRLIGIAEVEPQPNPAAPYKIVRLIQRWTELPDTIYFMNHGATGSPQATLLDGVPKIESTYQQQTINCHYVVFGSNGFITSPPPPTTDGSTFLALALGTGILRNQKMVPTQNSPQGPSYDLLQINRLSARIRNLSSR
jgi:type II secretory pathway pseudopilin PulG